ncbi:MAG: hypothetical protein ACJA0N_002621 [Pseudohongiellaceae bacterium]|jgi:hypothetical protein
MLIEQTSPLTHYDRANKMSTPSYIGTLERYHDYELLIKELMASILTGIADIQLLDDGKLLQDVMATLSDVYPFIDLLYTLDNNGIQQTDTALNKHLKTHQIPYLLNGSGKNRSRRPYFLLAQQSEQAIVTEPYLSNANSLLSVSAAIQITDEKGQTMGYIILDINLQMIIEMLIGDTTRRRFQPIFRCVYTIIVIGLFAVLASLLVIAGMELSTMFTINRHDSSATTKPFTIIIYLTLALAIFDLGKTVLEEEVLMHKDVYRHSSTRRTITRFIAAILIAVSIESLLLMFKSALGDGDHLIDAVWMMLAAVALLIGLGLYVYLGAKAEAILLKMRK